MKVISLEAERESVSEGEPTSIKGIELLVGLSPYFFPERLECDYDKDSGCFVIRFIYIDDEPSTEATTKDDVVRVFLGKHTGRLLELHIQVDDHDIDQITMLLAKTVTKAIERVPSGERSTEKNHRLAESVIRNRAGEIAASAFAAMS